MRLPWWSSHGWTSIVPSCLPDEYARGACHTRPGLLQPGTLTLTSYFFVLGLRRSIGGDCHLFMTQCLWCRHLDEQGRILQEAYRTISHELTRLIVEEEMLMRKLYQHMLAEGLIKKDRVGLPLILPINISSPRLTRKRPIDAAARRERPIDAGRGRSMRLRGERGRSMRLKQTKPITSEAGETIQSRSITGTGIEKNGMYHLVLPPPTAATTTTAVLASPSSLLWHARLGHASPPRMLSVCPDVPFSFPFYCDVCELSKHTRSTYVSSTSRATSCFELIHSDVWGPAPIVSFDGFSYFVTFIDDYSRCLWVYLLKRKSDVLSVYTHFTAMIQTQHGKSVHILRSDSGGEYTSRSFDEFLCSEGTLHQFSCPATPEQNGVAERKNRHLLDTVRCLLRGMHVPKSYWSAALLTAAFLINRTPSRPLGGIAPYSLLHPSASVFPIPLRVFGCVCFVQDRRPSRTKLDDRAVRCLFLGYSTTTKGYRCFDPRSRRIIHSRDVTFHEEVPFFVSSSTTPDPPTIVQPVPVVPTVSPPSSPPVLLTYTRRRAPTPAVTPISPSVPDPLLLPVAGTSLEPSPSTTSDDLPIALRKGQRACVHSSVTKHPLASVVSYQRFSPSYQVFVAAADSVRIPASTAEALLDSRWVRAMEEEMSALRHTGTWSLVPLPPGKRTVGCKWVYTVKYGADGSIDRYKARLVAKGFTQAPDEFGATFAPVAKLTSVRLLLSLAASRAWPLYQLDVKNAFLHGTLQEEVYMAPPPGFALKGEYSGRVCRLHKSLYGLKQSLRAWFDRFSTVILQIGFTQCHADHTCFVRAATDGRRAIVLVYVDDIILTGDDSAGISEVKATLRAAFEVKDLGSLRYFLGIEVARSRQGISISQRKYTLDLLRDSGLLGCRPARTPMDTNHRLHAESGDPLPDPSQYQRLVGRLIYLTNTRPDISFSVGVLSQFMHSPTTAHLEAARRVLRYLKHAPGLGLFYRADSVSSLSCFTDADFAGSLTDRRSTTGLCVFHGDHLVSWRSKKQHIVSRSSAESEYRAMAHGVTELIWLRSLLTELGLSLTTGSTLYCDNKSALLLTQDSVLHERTKHIEMDVHFLRDHVRTGTVLPTYVPSVDQLADAFTKALGPTRSDLLSSKLGMIDIFAPP
ncbi:hypothetical protein KSP39_PZI002722 [Platanthera zijinensis]|uniref:Integrase catalytic domain-containing protein n=1 Tax=Platanthera zijinensis TaxID=2320716 RepID=A0AAP0BZ56_9ASPA